MIAKICPLCQKIFGKDFIKDHIGIEHFGKNDAVDCKDCKGQVTRESDLKIHENIAHPKFNFHCDKCDKRFLSERSMNLHVQTMHSNSKRDLKYKCLISKVPKDVFKQRTYGWKDTSKWFMKKSGTTNVKIAVNFSLKEIN